MIADPYQRWTENPDKFTMNELMEMFGGLIPVAVMRMIFNAPKDKLLGEIRAEVMEYCKQYQAGLILLDNGIADHTVFTYDT